MGVQGSGGVDVDPAVHSALKELADIVLSKVGSQLTHILSTIARSRPSLSIHPSFAEHNARVLFLFSMVHSRSLVRLTCDCCICGTIVRMLLLRLVFTTAGSTAGAAA